MDIPLVKNHTGIRIWFKGYRRKSSTFSHQVDVDGLFVLYGDANKLSSIGYFHKYCFIKG